MKQIVTLAFVALVALAQGQNQNTSAHFLPDTEPYIAVNPTNANNLIAAWMRFNINLTTNIAVAYSNNGGQSWTQAGTLPHVSSTFTSADVSIAFNKTGTAYLTYVDYHPPKDSGFVVICTSTNGGANWSAPVKVIDGLEKPDLPVDRPWVAVDRSNGTYAGRIYVTAKSVDVGQMPHHVWMKSSSDGGLTWSTLQLIDDSIPTDLIANTMGAIDVGPDGSVNIQYFSWHLAQNIKPRAVMVKSTDGGATFTPYLIAYPASNSGMTDTLYQPSCHLAVNPTNANNIVFSFTDNRNGDPDILSLYSTNGGITWSSVPLRINDDAINNGVGQDMSWAGFSPNGTYSVAWRDRRNGGTGSSANFEVYASVSTDGGVTFYPNKKVSSAPSPVIPITKGNDFLGVSLSNTYLFTNWCDKRLGSNHEIYFNRDTLSKMVGVNEQLAREGSLIRCFPNPAGDLLNIRFELPAPDNLRLDIYDVLGRNVASSSTGPLPKGAQQLSYDCSRLKAGNYTLKLSGKDLNSQTVFTRSAER